MVWVAQPQHPHVNAAALTSPKLRIDTNPLFGLKYRVEIFGIIIISVMIWVLPTPYLRKSPRLDSTKLEMKD